MTQREVLKKLKAKYPGARHHRRTIVPPRKWPAFMTAAHFLMKNRTWKLIHGTVDGVGEFAGMRTPHAWMEKQGMVYDAHFEMFMTKAEFYRARGAKVSIEMSYRPAHEMMVLKQSYGPWEAV